MARRGSRDRAGDTGAAVVAATGTAVAGLAGHPLEALLGAAGFAALQPTIAAAWAWTADVFTRSAAELGGTVQELVDDLNSSPAKQEMLVKALELARSASLEKKRIAIASSLAAGAAAASEAEVAEESAILRILADIDLVDIQVLDALSQPRSQAWKAGYLGEHLYLVEDFSELLPALTGLVPRILAVLAANGLVIATEVEGLSGPGFQAWQITTAGRGLLDRFDTD